MIPPNVCFCVFLLKLVYGLNYLSKNQNDERFQLKIANGLVQGREESTDNNVKYLSFLGIPYAKPPIGNLRFAAPKPIEKWSGVLDATKEGSCCAGISPEGLSTINFTAVIGSEDCLYINVYTPKVRKNVTTNLLPIMFFIYGGGFIGGCSLKNTFYGPDRFMEEDVVVVTFNYRLGAFGFLSTADLECPGNWGIKDQIAALKWVQINIKHFGGDPQRVTVFGQSAGAASVNMLLLSPKSKGFFQGAILQSGSTLCPWTNQVNQRNVAFDVGITLGIETNSSKELISALRLVSAEELNRKQSMVILTNTVMLLSNGFPFAPSIEPFHKDAVLTDYGFKLMEKGYFSRIPIMIGVNTMELLFFQKFVELAKPFVSLWFDVTPGSLVRITNSIPDRYIIGNKIKRHFLQSNSFVDATDEELYRFFSEAMFLRPARKTASLLSTKNPVYFYVFSYEGQSGIDAVKYLSGEDNKKVQGVAHAEELFYLWKSDIIKNITKTDKMVSKKIVKLWTNFAKLGNPTPEKDPVLDDVIWPRASKNKCPYLDIGKNLRVAKDNYNEENFRFWEDIFNNYATKPYTYYY